jgi:hypothetical protein
MYNYILFGYIKHTHTHTHIYTHYYFLINFIQDPHEHTLGKSVLITPQLISSCTGITNDMPNEI